MNSVKLDDGFVQICPNCNKEGFFRWNLTFDLVYCSVCDAVIDPEKIITKKVEKSSKVIL